LRSLFHWRRLRDCRPAAGLAELLPISLWVVRKPESIGTTHRTACRLSEAPLLDRLDEALNRLRSRAESYGRILPSRVSGVSQPADVRPGSLACAFEQASELRTSGAGRKDASS